MVRIDALTIVVRVPVISRPSADLNRDVGNVQDDGSSARHAAAMKFGYAILYVDDVEETVAFYERAFGLKRKMVQPDEFGELDTGMGGAPGWRTQPKATSNSTLVIPRPFMSRRRAADRSRASPRSPWLRPRAS
jgi:hypothetical protein